MFDDKWDWTIGRVVGVFGRRGELKILPETDWPNRFDSIEKALFRDEKGAGRVLTVTDARYHKNWVLLHLEGVDDIDAAETFRGCLVQVPRSEAVVLPADSFYISDLLGAEVITIEGRRIGVVDAVLQGTANDVFQVGEALIPAIKEVIKEVDVGHRTIRVELIPGLLPDEPDAN
ncbi:MAG: ribosome maturation factor RimM [Armatimonadetes bacterium]|nr:ribosome maturation factor RimM [Armatimonadota bacterium]